MYGRKLDKYVIIGYFIDEEELKKLKRYETVTIETKEIPPINSCSHLSDETYLQGTIKYCPECGNKVWKCPGKPSSIRYEEKFTGYYEGFLNNSKVNIFDKDLYIQDKCSCDGYSGTCFCDLRKYGEGVKLLGLDLCDGNELMYDETQGYFIPYITMDSGDLEITSELFQFKERLEKFLNKFGISGTFELRLFSV